jgi:ubiquinone biosynthesis protein
VFASIEPEPIAAASLGQVHAATLADGTEVVVKVQRPNIQPTIAVDLEILQVVAAAAQRTPKGQIYDFVAMADDFAYSLNNELDYRLEARNADRFRANFADEPLLHIPLVYWQHTTARVVVLERMRGIKIDDLAALDAAGYDRHQVAVNSARIFCKQVLDDGFFHADAHPGNFLVMPGEVIGAMDFGRVGYLKDSDRLDVIHFYGAVVNLDSDGIVDRLVRMEAVNSEVDRQGLARDIDRLLLKYRGVQLGDVHLKQWDKEAEPIVLRYHLRLPPNLGLLAQTLIMMEGIGLTLDPDFDIWGFSEPYLRQVAWRLALPRQSWGHDLLRQGEQWSDLLSGLPRVANRLLEKADQGELLQIGLKDTGPIMKQADRLVTRLALTMLVAALTISLALLIPLATAGSPLQLPVTIGFAMAIALTIWLLMSILAGTR